ncbi:MAG TPA: anti-sigma factor [Kofleriaceae bacterium]|nr:anti-sigma factor [Kofleriaceae bacterium]
MKPALSPRAEELLAERAVRPLDDRELHELDALDASNDDSFDLAAASVAVALTPLETMPADLAAKILAASPAGFDAMKTVPGTSLMPGAIRTLPGVGLDAYRPQPDAQVVAREGEPLVASRGDVPVAPQGDVRVAPQGDALGAPKSDIERAREVRAKRSRFAVVAPWLAAAACLLAAVGALAWARDQGSGTKTVATLSPSDARADLLAHASDVTTIEWTTTADPTAQGAKGDVVWSQSAQKGFMRFAGLAVNDAKQFQYQLWIFDKTRDEAFPVDGGVFDVTASGEVIIPISAKLPVGDATLFAVTIEKPGGVVVSKRERIVVTAARKS